MSTSSFLDRLNNWARRSVMLKLLVIGFLMLILMIPGGMINSLIYERENIRDRAVQEVSSKWGNSQTLAGPVISVPYLSERIHENSEGEEVVTKMTGYVHFLPDNLEIDGQIDPQKRYRGIYVVVLYETNLAVSGHFGSFNLDAITVPEEDIQWEDALFTIGISDMRGVKDAIQLDFDGQQYAFGPGTVVRDVLHSGASMPIDLSDRTGRMDFSFDLALNGSTDLFFTPFGKSTKVTLESPWADPSFEGAFLPDDRSVTNEGFTAQWEVLQLNRNYPQQGKGAFISGINNNNNTNYDRHDPLRGPTSAFGLRLLLPVDEYHKTTRSSKYASFFIFITFLTFFFIEVLNKKRLHPIQYLLVGAAIILFYILLLSISEHLSFDSAYFIACAATLVLISVYCSFILKNRKLTMLVTGMLAILYGFFYSLLQLQDYSLLLGSIGLLLILGTVMYLTRNVDWYDLKKE